VADETFVNTVLGSRITRLRRAHGWTQHRLADLSGLSPSTVSRLENGKRTSVTLSVVARLAAALRCTVDDLVAPGGRTLGPVSGPGDGMAGLRRLVVCHGSPTAPADLPAWPQTVADADHAHRLRLRCDYTDAIRAGTWCLPHLEAALHGPHRRPAVPLLVRLYFDMAVIAKLYDDPTCAWMAAERAEDVGADGSRALGDPAAAIVYSQVMLRAGSPSRAYAVAETALAARGAGRGPQRAHLDGMLHLTAALSAARSAPEDRRTVRDHVRHADRLATAADAGPDPVGSDLLGVGATSINVRQWQAAIALERDDLDAADELLQGVPAAEIGLLSRRCAHYIDLARLRAAQGRPDQAARHLLQAEALAPQFRMRHPAAGALLASLRRELPDGLILSRLKRLPVAAGPDHRSGAAGGPAAR
jgi:DNA-binding Xre family transcriptional regulator